MGAACCTGSGAGALGSTSGGSPLSYFIGIAALVLDTKLAPVILTTLAAALAVPYVMLVLLTPKQLHISREECTYVDAAHPKKRKQLPSVSQPAETQLTVVVPAYNEERRLGKMLDDCIDWLESLRRERVALARAQRDSSAPRRDGKVPERPRRPALPAVQHALEHPLLTYEVLIVDDGSRDNTHGVAVEYACKKALPLGAEIRITGLQQNRGKGAAVWHGVMHARGALILFADADGATRFSELGELAREMLRIATPVGHGIVVGSRAHLVTSEAVVKVRHTRRWGMLTETAERAAQFPHALLPPAAVGADAAAEHLGAPAPRKRRVHAHGARGREAKTDRSRCGPAADAARDQGYPVRLQAVYAADGTARVPLRTHRPVDL